MVYDSKVIYGYKWKGLRGSGDTRVSSDYLNSTYMACYAVSFLVYTKPNGLNLVLVYTNWPSHDKNVEKSTMKLPAASGGVSF